MSPKSIKRFISALLISLSLTSFSLAGDIQCPIAPPPPPPEEDRLATVSNASSDKGDFQFINDFWEFLAQNADLL